MKKKTTFRDIETSEIIKTAKNLCDRIDERFPDSGLSNIANDLHTIAEEAASRSEKISRPHIQLRIVTWGLIISILSLTVWMFSHIPSLVNIPEAAEFIQAIEAGLGAVVFIGAGIIFLVSLERRTKRQQVLKAIHELRSMAQIVDMHQLTKHPEIQMVGSCNTPSSPKRDYSNFELNRYFNYCVELLSIISKIGYVYVDKFIDGQATQFVDQLEDLSYNLSCKIWQKIELNQESFGQKNKPVCEEKKTDTDKEAE